MTSAPKPPHHGIKAVIFDWDQTLWDSWKLHLGAIQHAASFAGQVSPSPERILDTFGGTLEEHLVRLYGSLERPMQGYLEFYHAQRLAMGRLFPGVAEVLASLRAAGYRSVVLSDKVESAGLEEVAMVKLEETFHAAVFRNGTLLAKPEPESLLHTLDMLHVTPAEALYVGDAPWDMECARRAGVTSVGALWGTVDVDALMAAKPDQVWRAPHEALGLLGARG